MRADWTWQHRYRSSRGLTDHRCHHGRKPGRKSPSYFKLQKVSTPSLTLFSTMRLLHSAVQPQPHVQEQSLGKRPGGSWVPTGLRVEGRYLSGELLPVDKVDFRNAYPLQMYLGHYCPNPGLSTRAEQGALGKCSFPVSDLWRK